MKLEILMAVFVCLWGACDCIDLERMISQQRVDVYEESAVFENGMAMQAPPQGTVPRGRLLGTGPQATGLVGDQYVAEIPIPVDQALLEHGRERFEIFCAACHGLLGNGASKVAENMALRPPPSLVDDPVRQLLPGHIFQVITRGYGLMPSYASKLSQHDRWAVIAYVQALKLAHEVPLRSLPQAVQREAKAALQ